MNLKKDFPIFTHRPELVYCDSAATSQKPYQVIEAISHFYAHDNAPVHRGIYMLAEHATAKYEAVRAQVADLIGSASSADIVFTHGATESINLVAQAWAAHRLKAGDEIVLTELEHHANMVPWQLLAKERGLVVRYIPVLPNATLDLMQLDAIITERTRLVAFTLSSNITGDISAELYQPIIAQARKFGARVLLDAAQALPHKQLDVRSLACDFLVFSGHKMLGPTGVGVLYVAPEVQTEMSVYQVGGSMVYSVGFETTSWRQFPYRLEAGTPPIAQVIGLGAALTYLTNNINFDLLRVHQASLCTALLDGLAKISGISILGDAQLLRKSGHLVTFTHNSMHAHDIAAFLDSRHICVRAGHHCAQPLHAKLGLTGSVRVSFYVYNTVQDVELLLIALRELFID